MSAFPLLQFFSFADMVIVISPAKTLEFEGAPISNTLTEPDFREESFKLIRKLRRMSRKKIGELMDISPKLALLNHERYLSWDSPESLAQALPAIQVFKGDVYLGLQVEQFSEEDLAFAQDHLRILSGLYGLLRPLDRIEPYRLEMGTTLPTRRGKDLYGFWRDSLSKTINGLLKEQEDTVLINLASKEYFKALENETLKARVITPAFKDRKGDTYKVLSFFAKKARGMMTAWIIQNRLTDPEQIKDFSGAGYRYNETLSEGDAWTFTREEQP